MFKVEQDLRVWLQERIGPRGRWVEPAMGSTTGLPDVWTTIDDSGEVYFIELKLGDWKPEHVKVEFRPAQRNQFCRMLRESLNVYCLAGERKGDRVLLAKLTENQLNGELKHKQPWTKLTLFIGHLVDYVE